MTIVYVALGSNLSNPAVQLQTAIQAIVSIPRTRIIRQSSVYETLPIGPQDQPNFMNQVIALDTGLLPHALLHALQTIENNMGRVRTVRWGPRVIDCDIILFGDEQINTPDLIIPHPEWTKREFVRCPLAEIYQ